MTESQFQSRLLKALRSHPALKDAVIFKHSDRFSRGIPDFSVTVNARTTWWEVKVAPGKTTKIQSWFLAKLGACAFVIKASSDGRWVEIFNATYGRGTQFASAIEEIVEQAVGGRKINA